MIWLAMSVRVRPCSERELRSSSGRVTRSWPSSSLTSIGLATVSASSPFGPLTVMAEPSTVTLTPAGMSIGRRPIRDMTWLPNVGEDFPTHALLGRLAVREEPGGGREDGNAESTENLGDFGRLCVNPEAGLRHALEPDDGALAVRAVL